jgi:hypothetical protein
MSLNSARAHDGALQFARTQLTIFLDSEEELGDDPTGVQSLNTDAQFARFLRSEKGTGTRSGRLYNLQSEMRRTFQAEASLEQAVTSAKERPRPHNPTAERSVSAYTQSYELEPWDSLAGSGLGSSVRKEVYTVATRHRAATHEVSGTIKLI